MEKIALDLIYFAKEKKYVLVGIDYFTRSIEASIIENKSGKQIVCHLEKWFENGFDPMKYN